MKPNAFIVVFDDESGMCVPMGADDDCKGAICACGSVRLFRSRDDARKAIKISRAFALLNKAQGKPENTDFTDAIKCVKVMPCY